MSTNWDTFVKTFSNLVIRRPCSLENRSGVSSTRCLVAKSINSQFSKLFYSKATSIPLMKSRPNEQRRNLDNCQRKPELLWSGRTRTYFDFRTVNNLKNCFLDTQVSLAPAPVAVSPPVREAYLLQNGHYGGRHRGGHGGWHGCRQGGRQYSKPSV